MMDGRIVRFTDPTCEREMKKPRWFVARWWKGKTISCTLLLTQGAARGKTAEQLAAEQKAEEESIIGQLGLTEHVDKAKNMANSAMETVKGFFPWGK